MLGANTQQKNPTYRAAIYMRLSRDDDGVKESSSISTQRKMLQSYAKENSFIVYDEYVDDGWSGTNFNRPDFKRMIQDIEDEHVNLVLTKDLSRLGRDYIITGQYTEIYFPSKNVRYIAINDGYDSISPYTDIAPFKNVINEMYARDTSKKIRSAISTKIKDGSYIGNFAPYGYKKDSENKNHLVLDDVTATIVKKIFKLAVNGKRPVDIARYLNDKKVPTPAMYRCLIHPYLDIDKYSKQKKWTSGTISKMLKNIDYVGHLAQGKTTKVSFKSHITIQNQREDWVVVKNTHEAIISQETYDIVQRRSQSRTCTKQGKFQNIFSGIAKCMDCGKNMSTVGTRKKGSVANLSCGAYKLHGRFACTNHFIDYDVLYNFILAAIREQIVVSQEDRKQLLEELLKEDVSLSKKNYDKNKISKLRQRLGELDRLIEQLYEDSIQGTLNKDRFHKMLSKYEIESYEIKQELNTLQDVQMTKDENLTKQAYDKLLRCIQDYSTIEVLTPDLLFSLIDHIDIGQSVVQNTDQGKVRHQNIVIYFRFIGTSKIKTCII